MSFKSLIIGAVVSDEKKENKEKKQDSIAGIPTLEYFQKTYASTISDDKKAAQIFKDYESQEKFRRLQQEVIWVREGMVLENVCDRVIGKKRKVKHQSYKHWAELMLLWMSNLKR